MAIIFRYQNQVESYLQSVDYSFLDMPDLSVKINDRITELLNGAKSFENALLNTLGCASMDALRRKLNDIDIQIQKNGFTGSQLAKELYGQAAIDLQMPNGRETAIRSQLQQQILQEVNNEARDWISNDPAIMRSLVNQAMGNIFNEYGVSGIEGKSRGAKLSGASTNELRRRINAVGDRINKYNTNKDKNMTLDYDSKIIIKNFSPTINIDENSLQYSFEYYNTIYGEASIQKGTDMRDQYQALPSDRAREIWDAIMKDRLIKYFQNKIPAAADVIPELIEANYTPGGQDFYTGDALTGITGLFGELSTLFAFAQAFPKNASNIWRWTGSVINASGKKSGSDIIAAFTEKYFGINIKNTVKDTTQQAEDLVKYDPYVGVNMFTEGADALAAVGVVNPDQAIDQVEQVLFMKGFNIPVVCNEGRYERGDQPEYNSTYTAIENISQKTQNLLSLTLPVCMRIQTIQNNLTDAAYAQDFSTLYRRGTDLYSGAEILQALQEQTNNLWEVTSSVDYHYISRKTGKNSTKNFNTIADYYNNVPPESRQDNDLTNGRLTSSFNFGAMRNRIYNNSKE